MKFKSTACLTFLALGLVASFQVTAQPAVIFDMGGKFDKSFNEAAYNGMERWKKESGKPYLEFEIANESQREQAARRMAERGASPIIGIGFGQASSIEKIAKEFPKLKFAIVDMVVDQPNVQSVVFKEHEGSFLVGAMAAMASKTGKVSFVGGMDIPLIRKFQCGYEQGAKFVNPKAEVFSNMTGTTTCAMRCNKPVCKAHNASTCRQTTLMRIMRVRRFMTSVGQRGRRVDADLHYRTGRDTGFGLSHMT